MAAIQAFLNLFTGLCVSNVSEIGIIVRDKASVSWEWVRLPRLRIVRLTVSRLDQLDIARDLKPTKFIVTWNPRLGHRQITKKTSKIH